MNIVLCGMMGVGKTTVGLALAKHTAREWLDTDTLIEERHGKISELFANYGEAYFRALETQTVSSLLGKDNLVLSVGGGLVLREENVELLKKCGKIVYLRAQKQTLVHRLLLDTTRPLLQGKDSLEERIETLLQARASTYERVADCTVDVDDKTPEQIAIEIVEKLG